MGLITKNLVLYCIIASFGAIIYGWEVGMLNIIYSMKDTFGKTFDMHRFDPVKKTFVETDSKSTKESIITPTFTLGCFIGNFIALKLLDRRGRSKCLIVGSFIYIIGAVIQMVSSSVVVFCIGRCIAGIACGMTMVTAPMYVAEITPKEVRGTMGMGTTFGLQGGIFLASLCDTISLKLIDGEAQWRVAVGSQLIPGVLFLVLVWFIPETPRYMMVNGHDDKALKTLAKIRNRSEDDKMVVEEYNDISSKIKIEMTKGKSTWSELFGSKSLTYRVIIASLLQLLHMLVGVNAISYYSSQIFNNYLDIPLAKWGAWLVTINNFVVFVLSLPAARYVEKAGRRALLVWGAILLAICMLMIVIMCYILEVTENKAFGWLCVVFVYLYSVIYGWTWSTAIFVWQSEVFPMRMRTKANTVANVFQYIGSALVTSTTSTFMKHIKYYTFLIYMTFGFIAFIFSYFCVKETRGRSLEDMETLYGNHELKYDEFIEQDTKKHAEELHEENVKEC